PPAGSARAAGGCAGLSALTGGVRAASCNGARGRQPGIKTAPDRGLTWARALHSFAQLRQNRQNQLLFEVPLNQTIENLQADLAISINKIVELEKAKADAERAPKQAEQAKLDAENAKQEVERTRIAEKMTSDALVAQLRADKVRAVAKSSRWEHALYASLGALLLMLTASTIGFFMNRHKASVSKQQVWEPGTKPIEVPAQCQKSEACRQRH